MMGAKLFELPSQEELRMAAAPSGMTDLQVAESQRLDRWYAAIAAAGYDATTVETDKAALQRYAARRSRTTRERLFGLIDDRIGA